MARKKSYKDIQAQMQKLYAMDRAANGGSWRVTDRQYKIQNIGQRYLDNIAHKRGKKEVFTTPMGNKYTKITINDKAYSRSTYMSSNNG